MCELEKSQLQTIFHFKFYRERYKCHLIVSPTSHLKDFKASALGCDYEWHPRGAREKVFDMLAKFEACFEIEDFDDQASFV